MGPVAVFVVAVVVDGAAVTSMVAVAWATGVSVAVVAGAVAVAFDGAAAGAVGTIVTVTVDRAVFRRLLRLHPVNVSAVVAMAMKPPCKTDFRRVCGM